MKKFLKIIAIILVIIALLLIISALVSYMGGPNMLGKAFGPESWLGKLSMEYVIALAIGVLVIAAVISPKGFAKAMERVTSGVSLVGEKVASMVTRTASSILGGAVSGFFSNNGWLYAILAGAAIYMLWPDSDDRSRRAEARMRELEVKERELILESAHAVKGGTNA